MKKTIQMEELVCPMCAQKIETAMQKAPGVVSASVLYNASKVKIEFDETKTNVDELVKVITELGYVVIGQRNRGQHERRDNKEPK